MLLLRFRCMFVSQWKRKWNCKDLSGWRCGEALGEDAAGEIVIRMYLLYTKYLFSTIFLYIQMTFFSKWKLERVYQNKSKQLVLNHDSILL